MVGFERNSTHLPLQDTDYVVAGATSGFLTRTIFQPLDVIKIRFQLQIEPIDKKCPGSKYRGIVHAFKSILKEEGTVALWKGIVPAQFLSIGYGALQFLAYELLTDQANIRISENILAKTKPGVNFVCGALAGCVATTGSFPFDILRTRLVAQGEPKTYQNLFHAAGTMFRNEGVFSFYKGLTPTLAQIAPNAGAQFAFYQAFQGLWMLSPDAASVIPSAVQNGVSGAAAGMAAKITVYPLDLIKKRIQVQGFEEARKAFGSTRKYTGLIHCVVSIFREESVIGLYKGLWPSILKAAFTTGSHFLFYEETLKVLSHMQR